MLSDLEQQTLARNSDTIQNAEWIVELDFDQSGAYHMERDETLARERLADPALPNVLRLYSWSPPAVSIGYQQKMESIDLDACRDSGVDVVRRPTGGRAVLHFNELTYAVIMQTSESGIYASHNLIVESLIRSLNGLGEQASLLKITGRAIDENFQETYKEGLPTNMACFASTARHEAVYNGRKVIGSAQRRFGNVLLQHGSILLSDDHLRLPEFLAMAEERRGSMLALLKRETATLSEVFGRTLYPEEVAESVSTRFVSDICELQEIHTHALAS